MIKDISKIKMWHIWKVTYLRRNVTIVCGVSYHLLGSQISWELKIRFQLQVKFYISGWWYSESQHLARYVSRHNAMAYDRYWFFWAAMKGISLASTHNPIRLSLKFGHNVLEEEVPTELKVLLTLTGTLTSLLKHTAGDPAPGCLSRRRIVKMIYFKLQVLYFHIRNPCTHMLPNMLPIT